MVLKQNHFSKYVDFEKNYLSMLVQGALRICQVNAVEKACIISHGVLNIE